KLIQILLLGQPELDAMLESEELRQLRQRIAVRWRLAPLSREETGEYVRHRLRVSAGSDRDHVFGDGAVREVFRRSHGVPRVVNLLCDRALLAAFGDGSPTVGAVHVGRAARETGAGSGARAPGPARRAALVAAAAGLGMLAAGAGWLGTRAGREGGPPRAPARAAALAGPSAVAPVAAVGSGDPVPALATSEPLPGVAAAPPLAVAPADAPPASDPAGEPIDDDPVAEPPAPAEIPHVDDLPHALALRAPGATAAAALAGALDAWALGGEADERAPLRLPDLLDTLEAH